MSLLASSQSWLKVVSPGVPEYPLTNIHNFEHLPTDGL